jgi:hypothetical protein
MAIVMGPSPPGTGVIFEATRLASLQQTSPTSQYPFFFDKSWRNGEKKVSNTALQ